MHQAIGRVAKVISIHVPTPIWLGFDTVRHCPLPILGIDGIGRELIAMEAKWVAGACRLIRLV